MNESEYTEHLLLSSLEECHFNHSRQKRHYEEQKQPVSTGTLSTEEELLDEVDLFGDGESFVHINRDNDIDDDDDNNDKDNNNIAEVVLPLRRRYRLWQRQQSLQ